MEFRKKFHNQFYTVLVPAFFFALTRVHSRYDRTILGAYWETLTVAFYVSLIAVVWSNVLGQELSEFLPYLAISWIFWNFLSRNIVGGPSVFIENRAEIENFRRPLIFYCIRECMHNVIIFAYQCITICFVILFSGLDLRLSSILVFAAVILVFCTSVIYYYVMGLVSLRYRDLPVLIGAVMPAFFFLTPILWKPSENGLLGLVTAYNPLTYYIEMFREPLLGAPFQIQNYFVCVGMLVLLVLAAVALKRGMSRDVYFWL